MSVVDPLAAYTGSLQCQNWADLSESGGVPAAQLTVWADRLEMVGRGPFRVLFRFRTVPKDRVQLVRPLLPEHPLQELIEAVHPLARGRQFFNFVVRPPKGQSLPSGNIHYVLATRGPGATEILNVLEAEGFPVSHTPVRIAQLNIFSALSWLDWSQQPGRR